MSGAATAQQLSTDGDSAGGAKALRSETQLSLAFHEHSGARRRAGLSGPVLTPRQRGNRLRAILILSLLWSAVLVARLYSLQISDFERWQGWAVRQQKSEVTLASERGPIYDRENRLLAVSVPSGSLYVRPKQISPKDAASLDALAAQLAELLEEKPSVIRAKLTEQKPFVWLKRQVPRALADEVVGRKIPGIGSVLESKRLYPFGDAASSLIGKAGIDGSGLSGIERVFDSKLQGTPYQVRVAKDALGNQIDISGQQEFELPRGESLQLTIDSSIQVIMDEEVEAGRTFAKAERALAVMIDSNTGEVLGMSQSPRVDMNLAASKKSLGNLAVETVFEPGSIMKPLVAAAAIERGVVTPKELIDCENGRYLFAGKVIKDVHPSGIISFFDVIVSSSNIGMTKIGMKLGARNLYDSLRGFGFGETPHLGLPGETPGILRPVSRWAGVDVATQSFGQGIAVTPIQVVRATAAIANGGRLPKLSIVSPPNASFESTKILSERTTAQVREMMYGVIEAEHGTGHKAAIDGVRIGGKTGTAQKARVDGRGYDPGKYIAGFVGFADGAPIGVQRNVTLMVVVDEPNTNSIYGGTLAAPVFKRIMQRTLHYLSTSANLAPRKDAASL